MRWLILLFSVSTVLADEAGSLRNLLATGRATWLSPDGEAAFERLEAKREFAVRFEAPAMDAPQVGDASGWALSPRWVVTKSSLLRGARTQVNGIAAEVTARWEEEDLALLELAEALPGLASFPRGAAETGDLVTAGKTFGVVSRAGSDRIATDLALPVKSLGGPVTNLRGEVIGIAIRVTEWKATEVLPADRIWAWVKSLRAANSKIGAVL